jgi:hypothetical protein
MPSDSSVMGLLGRLKAGEPGAAQHLWGALIHPTGPTGTPTASARRLALLADALEDASCADADLPGSLRDPEPHVRGCWAVDLNNAQDVAKMTLRPVRSPAPKMLSHVC